MKKISLLIILFIPAFIMAQICPLHRTGDRNCITFAGTMDVTLQILCEDDCITATNNADEVLETGGPGIDMLEYYLHTSSDTILGTIIDHNISGYFCFLPGDMYYNSVYYISAVAGDELGGSVDLNDTCLSVSCGKPVIWYEQPVADAYYLLDDENVWVCGLEFDMLAEYSIDSSTGQWSVLDATGVVFEDIFDPGTHVTVPDSGYYTFVWEEQNAYNPLCSSTDTIVLHFLAIPDPFAGYDTIVCGDSTNLECESDFGTGQWLDNAAVWFSDQSDPHTWTGPYGGAHNESYEYIWQESNGPAVSQDTVYIYFAEIPDAQHYMGSDTIINCGLTTSEFNWLDAQTSEYSGWWTAPYTSGVVYDPDSTSLTTSVTVPYYGVHTFYWVLENVIDSTHSSFGWSDPVITNFLPTASITGTVPYDDNFLHENDATVNLYNQGSYGFDLVQSTGINSNDQFVFNISNEDTYYIKVLLNEPEDFPYVVNSYYNNTYSWENCQAIEMSCGTDEVIVVNMFEIIPEGNGQGHVSGTIYYGLQGQGNGYPVQDADIFLEQEPEGNIVDHTKSDESGYYQITEIPEGDYSLVVDVPGIYQITTHEFTVTASEYIFEDLDFIVDTTGKSGIYAYDPTGVDEIIKEGLHYIIYPNPFKDKIIIEYSLQRPGQVLIEVYDITGRKVETVINERQEVGEYREYFNGGNKDTAVGVYYVKMRFDNIIFVDKIIRF